MALKVTTKDGHVIEGDTQEVIAALRALQDIPAPKPRRVPGPANDLIPAEEHEETDDGSRNPRGFNRKLVLEALQSAGSYGLLQARVQQWVLHNKQQDLAISSVRHALNQLFEKGYAVRERDVWKITLAGVTALAVDTTEPKYGSQL